MPRLVQLASLEAVRMHAEEWDDLWQRSDVTSPMARAELVALWAEQFASNAPFLALVVEDKGRWVAALPLVGKRVVRAVSAGVVPANSWVAGGSFLLDPSCEIDAVMRLLAKGLTRIPWQLLWLDEIQLDMPHWRLLEHSWRDVGMPTSRLARYCVGRIDIENDWPTFSGRLSRAFRKNLRRSYGRLEHYGEFTFKLQSCFDLAEVGAAIQRGFTVEHRSWKGRTQTSVLATGLLPFYVRQARQLARWGQLQLGFLEIAQKPVAFVYAAVGKGVYHSYKVGYDEEFGRCSPGLLLEQNIFQRLWKDPTYHAIDFIGVLSEAERHWRPKTYQIGRIVVATSGALAPSIVVYLHENWWPRLRQWRRRFRRIPPPVAETDSNGNASDEMDQLSVSAGEPQR